MDVASAVIGVTPKRLRLLPGAYVIGRELTAHHPQTLRVEVRSGPVWRGAADAVTATVASTTPPMRSGEESFERTFRR